jgi:hypothetical protein
MMVEVDHNGLDMTRILALATAICLYALTVSLSAADPLIGTWRLQQQEVNGQKGEPDPMALQVSQSGDKFTFAFSVPINEIYFVTLSYTLRLDGSQADIKDANGQKIGTIQMTRGGAGQYKLVMKGASRPDSQGTLTISADGKALVSESDASQAGRSLHSKQTFARD